MSQGMSTRAVGSPIGTAGKFAPAQRTMRVVPLSAFFLDAEDQDEADKENVLTGFRRKKRQADPKDRPERVNKDKTKTKADNKSKPDSGGFVGGDANAADAAVAGRQSTASSASSGKQESATMSGGTPLIAPDGAIRAASFPGGASKLGATHSTGVTGTGNVAQYPVRIGGRRRRRKKQESLSRWIARLGKSVS